VRHFEEMHAHFVFNGGKDNVYSIQDLTISEDMFLRTEVSVEESLKVPNIPLTLPDHSGRLTTKMTKSQVGLWKIDQSQFEWAQAHADRLREMALKQRPLTRVQVMSQYNSDRTWVSDDEPIMGLIREDLRGVSATTRIYVIITSDRKLCKLIQKMFLTPVMQLLPRELVYYVNSNIRDFDVNDLIKIQTYVRTKARDKIRGIRYWDHRDPLVIMDTGAWASELVKYESGKDFDTSAALSLEMSKFQVKTLIETKFDREINKRIESYSLTALPDRSSLTFTIHSDRDEFAKGKKKYNDNSTIPTIIVEDEIDNASSLSRSSTRLENIHRQYQIDDDYIT
jgi:hypothetical protein